MKPIFLIALMFAAAALQGCIHTYPDDKAEDPTEVGIALDISLNLKWKPITTFHPSSDTDSGNISSFSSSRSTPQVRRIVVDIKSETAPAFHFEQTLDRETSDDESIRMILPVSLKPEVYRMAVWLDPVEEESGAPTLFDAEDLASVTPLHPDTDLSALESCGASATTLDLTEYRNSLSTRLIVPVELTPPAAKFIFTATDVEKFLVYADHALQKGEKYSVRFSLDSPRGSAFNAFLGSPDGAATQLEFSTPLPTLFSTHATICRGWLFAREEREYLSASVTLFNSARMIVSKVTGIRFPVERGKTTTVRGEFLTNFYTHNINIDNLWDDEIIIDIE